MAGRIEPDLVDGDLAEAVWAAAVAAPAWDGPGVWTHRDLHGGNLLTAGARLTGVIDFGGLVVGDPATDVMGAFHVLSPSDRRLFCDLVGVDEATLARARGLALAQGLEALPYYLDTHPGMVSFARRAIAATLGPQCRESSQQGCTAAPTDQGGVPSRAGHHHTEELTVFVQIIQGQVDDASALQAALDRWVSDLAGGATGWLGSTSGVTDDGTFLTVARFDDEEAARENSDRPEQDQWWAETSQLFRGEATLL